MCALTGSYEYDSYRLVEPLHVVDVIPTRGNLVTGYHVSVWWAWYSATQLSARHLPEVVGNVHAFPSQGVRRIINDCSR
jgi:hypothetical protein